MFRPRKSGLGVDTPQNLDYDKVMTYIAALDPNSTVNTMAWSHLDDADATIPGWYEREQYGTRFLTENDFPVYDDSADQSRVSNDDWEMFFGSR